MPIIKNVELHYLRLDPEHPDSRFDKEKPRWSVQIRPRSKAQKKEFTDLGLNMKAKYEEDEESESQKLLYRYVSIAKGVYKRKKNEEDEPEMNEPVECVNHRNEPIDPQTVANGSIGNVRVFQYENSKSKTGVSTILLGVQVTTHYWREPTLYEAFDEEEGEVIMPTEESHPEYSASDDAGQDEGYEEVEADDEGGIYEEEVEDEETETDGEEEEEEAEVEEGEEEGEEEEEEEFEELPTKKPATKPVTKSATKKPGVTPAAKTGNKPSVPAKKPGVPKAPGIKTPNKSSSK